MSFGKPLHNVEIAKSSNNIYYYPTTESLDVAMLTSALLLGLRKGQVVPGRRANLLGALHCACTSGTPTRTALAHAT